MVMLKGVVSAETEEKIYILTKEIRPIYFSEKAETTPGLLLPWRLLLKFCSWWASELIAVSYGALFISLSSIVDTVSRNWEKSFAKGFAGNVLQKKFCRKCFAENVLQKMFCRKSFAENVLHNVLQESLHINVLQKCFAKSFAKCFAENVLQKMFCRKCFAENVLQKSFAGKPSHKCFAKMFCKKFCRKCFAENVLQKMFCIMFCKKVLQESFCKNVLQKVLQNVLQRFLSHKGVFLRRSFSFSYFQEGSFIFKHKIKKYFFSLGSSYYQYPQQCGDRSHQVDDQEYLWPRPENAKGCSLCFLREINRTNFLRQCVFFLSFSGK